VTLTAEFHPHALNELRIARQWYEQIQPELGRQFAAHVARAVESVLENPMMYAAAIQNIRRMPIYPFPYHIYYEVFADRLRFFGVFHSHRNPATISEQIAGRKSQF